MFTILLYTETKEIARGGDKKCHNCHNTIPVALVAGKINNTHLFL
jgi:hypothetical protein